MTPKELKQKREILFPGRNGITQMSKALNTPRSTYIKWENGQRRVPGIVEVAILAIINDNIKFSQ